MAREEQSMKLLLENWRKYLNESVDTAVNQILKKEDEFDILGHGTNMTSVNLILSSGFRIDRDLNKTFLRVDKNSINTQLEEWPYGERGSGSTGIVFMAIPKGQLETDDLKDRISDEAEGEETIQDPDLGAIGGVGKRVIPPYFFFAVWDEDKQELKFNPSYDENKIYDKLQTKKPIEKELEQDIEPVDDDVF